MLQHEPLLPQITLGRAVPVGRPVRPADREGWARRLLNVAVAAVGLVLALPLMLTLAALIKVTSRGPVLFKQKRIGLDRRALSRAGGNTRRQIDCGGMLFTMYKFRTMYIDRHDEARQAWAEPNDHRVTPVGRVLRRLRLDELP